MYQGAAYMAELFTGKRMNRFVKTTTPSLADCAGQRTSLMRTGVMARVVRDGAYTGHVTAKPAVGRTPYLILNMFIRVEEE